jgi:hypothetical protein
MVNDGEHDGINNGINNGIICLVIWNLIFMTYLGNNDPN